MHLDGLAVLDWMAVLDWLRLGLTVVLAGLMMGAIAFYLACAYFTTKFFRHPPKLDPGIDEGVSILVPCCGLDAGAWENWSSFCNQDWQDYEVIFGVVDPADPSVPVIERLREAYPQRVKLFTGLEPRGANHKDSSLSYLVPECRYDVIIFADSDICVAPDYIHTVTAPLVDPTLGMVTCAYVAHRPRFVGAALASLNRCCDFIPSALVARAMDGGIKFAIGVTMAMRREALEAAGGLHLNRIGSDYNLGKRVAAAGYRVELSHLILESDTGQESLGDVWRRELRWARTIRFNRGPVYYGQVVCFGLVYVLPLLVVTRFAGWAIALSALTILVRYFQAWVAAQQVGAPKLSQWFWLLSLRDLMTFGIWLAGAFGDRIHWRGRQLSIEGDGIIREV